MLAELLKIYDQSRVNPALPECLFAETLIFNEGWLLRAVLQDWKTRPLRSRFDFLPLPKNARLYSEGQLYTPFKRRKQRDEHAEGHAHVDGIVGDFCLASGSRSGIAVNPGCTYLAVFEAKMASSLSKGVKNAANYSQVARIAACIIHAVVEGACAEDLIPYLIILYPQHNKGIRPGEYTKEHVEAQIAERIQGYLGSAETREPVARFFREWRRVLERVQIQFLTWEQVVADMSDADLDRFYELCQRFNSANQGAEGAAKQ